MRGALPRANLAYDEIGAALGRPVGTIKTWLRRTLETVRTDCAAFEAQAAN